MVRTTRRQCLHFVCEYCVDLIDADHLPPKEPETTNFARTKSKNEYREINATAVRATPEKTSPPLANLFGLGGSPTEPSYREHLPFSEEQHTSPHERFQKLVKVRRQDNGVGRDAHHQYGLWYGCVTVTAN